MAIGEYDVVGRAARVLRTQPEPGWDRIENSVIDAVRATARSGWPLSADDPDPATPGALSVSDLVLSTELSRALAGADDLIVTDIHISSAGTEVREVLIELSARYLTDLAALTERVSQICSAVIADVIGPGRDVPLRVIVSDVHR